MLILPLKWTKHMIRRVILETAAVLPWIKGMRCTFIKAAEEYFHIGVISFALTGVNI